MQGPTAILRRPGPSEVTGTGLAFRRTGSSLPAPRRVSSAMDATLLLSLLLILFVLLIGVGRSQLARATSVPLANGVVLLILATLLGMLALPSLGSLT